MDLMTEDTTGTEEEVVADAVGTPSPASSHEACCADCAARDAAQAEEFVYVLGRVDVRFPSLGIEREFEQRARRLPAKAREGSRRSVIRRTLEESPHLAAHVCYLLLVGGLPAYVLGPTSPSTRDALFEALEQADRPDHSTLIIGRRGPLAPPSACAGVLAPVVACSQVWSFSLAERNAELAGYLPDKAPAAKAAKLQQVAHEIFDQVAMSTENLGATDAHRALNYVLLQNPGLFLAVAERSGSHVLDRIETRHVHGLGTRSVVAVILTFVDVKTGVPERLFCRVDVTEQWPFLADAPDGRRAPLGMLPFVDNSVIEIGY
jgi:hypothetical protein